MGLNVDYVQKRIIEIDSVIDELNRLTQKEFSDTNLDEKYSIRYQIIVLAEALGSLCLHFVLEETKEQPSSYAECFTILEKKDWMCPCSEIIQIIRLRNLVIHRYWIVDDKLIYNAIKENFRNVTDFLEAVRIYIESKN